jgi:hypothetical protein
MNHKEIFQPLSTINYEQLAHDLYNCQPRMPEHIKLPASKFAHVYRAPSYTPAPAPYQSQ